MEEIDTLLRTLFENAKKFDELSEWEFIQTLMRDKYSNNMYTSSQVIRHNDIYDFLYEEESNNKFRRQVLEENIASISSLILIGNELMDSFDKMIRIRLITYSCITEVKYIQNVIANLLWISMGKKFFPDPFAGNVARKYLSEDELEELGEVLDVNIKEYDTLRRTEKRFKLICYLCDKANISLLSKYIGAFYNNHLRNSIFHSRYFFSEDGFVGIDDNEVIKLSKEELAEKIDKCIYFFISLVNLLNEYRLNYDKTKSIKGRNIDYEANNNMDDGDIVKIDIVGNNKVGIVSTVITICRDDISKDEDDGFHEKFLEFMSEYPSIIENEDDG